MEDKQLNGTGRFVIDNLASEEECKILSDLVNVRLNLLNCQDLLRAARVPE